MDEPGPARAGHAYYIRAVVRCLHEQDIAVPVADTGNSHGVRFAELHVRPGPDAFATTVPAEAFLSWDEENGWALALRRDSSTLTFVNPVYKGLSVLPDPDDVASWVTVLLAHPGLTPSREDHPFRDHSVDDPDFEAQLTRYASGG